MAGWRPEPAERQAGQGGLLYFTLVPLFNFDILLRDETLNLNNERGPLCFQVYRDLKEVTPEAMQMVKRNFEWVSERVKVL